jgi:hypothetical protein
VQAIYVDILKICYSGNSAGLLQREGKYSRIGLSIADFFFINNYN